MTNKLINLSKTILLILICLLINTQLSTAEESLFIESLGHTFKKYEVQQLNRLRFSETPVLENDLKKLKNFDRLNEISFHKTKLPEFVFDHLVVCL